MHWKGWRTGTCLVNLMRYLIFAKSYSVTSTRRLNYCCCFDIVLLSGKIASAYSCIVSFTWDDDKTWEWYWSSVIKTVVMQDYKNYTVARDTFLAHLGATLRGSMRHIISPSLADGAFHYYEKISFQLFFITQEVWC